MGLKIDCLKGLNLGRGASLPVHSRHRIHPGAVPASHNVIIWHACDLLFRSDLNYKHKSAIYRCNNQTTQFFITILILLEDDAVDPRFKMPPFLPRKRLSSTPPRSPQSHPNKKAKLSDALDNAGTRGPPGLNSTKTFSLGSDDSESSLSDIDSDQFEDVPHIDKHVSKRPQKVEVTQEEDEEDDGDDDIEWEDVAVTEGTDSVAVNTPLAGGDIQITFRKDDEMPEYGLGAAATSSRKGPSKREKEARVTTHQRHSTLR